MLTGLVDDIADGPDAVDRDQLDLAGIAARRRRLRRGRHRRPGPGPTGRWAPSSATCSTARARVRHRRGRGRRDFDKLERFLESRLRRET